MFRFDYLKLLEEQCNCVYPQTDLKRSKSIFCEICRNLNRDFLPPIEREDIAAISFSLVDITSNINAKTFPDDIIKQLISLRHLLKGLFSKSKACGDDIRRLMEINVNFKNSNLEIVLLNEALSDFLKTVLCAYFRNL